MQLLARLIEALLDQVSSMRVIGGELQRWRQDGYVQAADIVTRDDGCVVRVLPNILFRLEVRRDDLIDEFRVLGNPWAQARDDRAAVYDAAPAKQNASARDQAENLAPDRLGRHHSVRSFRLDDGELTRDRHVD